LKVLRLGNNGFGSKMRHWGVIVDDEGKVIEGGLGRQLGGGR